MARIIITGEREPLQVPDGEAEVILAQVSDPAYKGRITIPLAGGGTRSVSKHNVRDVQIGRDPDMGGAMVNVDTSQGRAQAEELERELDAYQAKAVLDRDLEWYGAPLEGHSEDAEARLRASGIVGNEILGAAHWSTVQWTLDRKLIVRRVDEIVPWHLKGALRPKPIHRTRFAVAAEDRGGVLDPSAYNRFSRVWAGVKELRSRRLNAARAARAADDARLASLVAEADEEPAQAPTEANIDNEPILPRVDL